MSWEYLVILLIVGGLAGAIGQRLAGYSRGGWLTSIALGIIGALIGTWVVKQFKLPDIYALKIGNAQFLIVWAILGAATLAALYGLVRRRRYL